MQGNATSRKSPSSTEAVPAVRLRDAQPPHAKQSMQDAATRRAKVSGLTRQVLDRLERHSAEDTEKRSAADRPNAVDDGALFRSWAFK